MSNYITLAEVKNYLKINSVEHDSRLSNLIAYGCSVIENYCGRTFTANTYTEVFDGGTSSIFVSNIPINNVHQVLEYDGSQYQVLDGPTVDAGIVDATKNSKSIVAYPGFSLQNRYVKFGITSAQFNGISGYLSIADSDDFWFDTLPFTLEGWIRFNTFAQAQTLFSQVEDDNNYWRMFYDTSQGISFEVKQGGTQVINVVDGSTVDYATSQFMHIAISKDENNTIRIFKDGIRISSNVTVATPISNFNAPVEIGRQNLTNKNYFSGQMDEVRFSLNTFRYNADFTPQTYRFATDSYTTLLLHYNGQNQSTSTQDSSMAREQYTWYPETGEITKHVGEDTGQVTMSILGTKKFNNYVRGIKVTYNGGYTTIPMDIKLATLDYVKELHKGLESRSVSLQGENMVAFDFTGGFAPHIRRVLDLYRIIM